MWTLFALQETKRRSSYCRYQESTSSVIIGCWVPIKFLTLPKLRYMNLMPNLRLSQWFGYCCSPKNWTNVGNASQKNESQDMHLCPLLLSVEHLQRHAGPIQLLAKKRVLNALHPCDHRFSPLAKTISPFFYKKQNIQKIVIT